MEKTLVILKPGAVQRALVGEVTARFERKGLRLAGMKMMQLTDELLNEHYAHLAGKPFFQRIKNSMMASPVICCCYEGVDAVETFGMSFQENIIHTSDSPENAVIELNRFFKPEEIFDYTPGVFQYLYANDEY